MNRIAPNSSAVHSNGHNARQDGQVEDLRVAPPHRDHVQQPTNPAHVRPNPFPQHVEPSGQASGRNLDFISTERSADEYEQALRHSGKVRLWRIVLPVIAVLIMVAIVLALVVNAMLAPDAAIDAVSLEDGNLVMENPHLNGFDKNKRPFSLMADRAIQDASNPTRVELRSISAELPVDETVSAKVQAGNGIYDAEKKTLVLQQDIRLETDTGMKLELDDADIDIGEGRMTTSGGIVVTSPQADISADSIFVEESGNRIVFTGNVRMTVRPDEMRKVTEKE